MAKRRNEPIKTTNSKAPIAMMVVAAIAVIALVAWALTRSVDPTPSVAESIPAQQTGAVDTSTFSTPPASNTAWSPTAPSTSQPGTPQVTMTPPPISSVPPPTASGVTRIAAEDLKSKFDRGEVTILDIRDATSYAQGHIPGAILVPMASVQTEIPNLPKNKPIVAYCT